MLLILDSLLSQGKQKGYKNFRRDLSMKYDHNISSESQFTFSIKVHSR